jgi:hypothetical protein
MKIIFRLLLGCMMFALLAVCIRAVACGEMLPWGVERIRTPCVWDQDEDMVVDEGGHNGLACAYV